MEATEGLRQKSKGKVLGRATLRKGFAIVAKGERRGKGGCSVDDC
jgi:hypothetical protein